MLALTATWGAGFVAGKVVVRHAPAITATGARFGAAGIVLLLIGHSDERGRLPSLRESVLASLVTTGLYLFWNLGLRRTTAGGSALLVNTSPVFVSLLARLLFGDQITARKVFGLAAATLGVAIAVVDGAIGSWSGIACCLAAALCWAAFTIVAKVAAASDAVVLYGRSLSVAGLVLFVVGIASETHRVDLSLDLVVSCVFLFAIVFNLVGWASLVRRRPASQIAPALFLIPP